MKFLEKFQSEFSKTWQIIAKYEFIKNNNHKI